MLDANFWHDKSLAQKVIKEKKLYENLINSYEESRKKLNADVLIEAVNNVIVLH